MSITVRDAQSADLEWVLKLNNQSTPAVNELNADRLQRMADMAAYFRVARYEGRRSGFLLALAPSAPYESPNFLWFKNLYPHFLYIDRVVIAPDTRRLGIGRVLYADVISYTERTAPLLTCEVNIKPANPGSVLFHSGQGFAEVGQQDIAGTDKRVSLLALDIPSYSFVRSRKTES